MDTRIPTSPQPWPETQEFWDNIRERRLMLQRCKATGKVFFYPRSQSPFTGQQDTEWVQASGKGKIYSFSVLPRAKPAYCLAYVTLAEGPTILSNIITANFDAIHIGQAVHLTFVESENGQLIPMFRID